MTNRQFRTIRLEASLTQEQLSWIINRSVETIKRYERPMASKRYLKIPSTVMHRMQILAVHQCHPKHVMTSIYKGLVIDAIHLETRRSLKKEKIMIAYEEGLLTSDEASDWISLLGLQTA
jgi:hypothetical protein